MINEKSIDLIKSKKLNKDVINNEKIFPIISPVEIFLIPSMIVVKELEDDFRRLFSEI